MPFDQTPLTTLDAKHPLATKPDDDPSSSKRPMQLSKSTSTRRQKTAPHRCGTKEQVPKSTETRNRSSAKPWGSASSGGPSCSALRRDVQDLFLTSFGRSVLQRIQWLVLTFTNHCPRLLGPTCRATLRRSGEIAPCAQRHNPLPAVFFNPMAVALPAGRPASARPMPQRSV